MRFAATIIWVLLPIAAGTGLYLLKMQVEAQEQRLASLHRDIAEAEESIHVLKAEWSYLNEPVRLREEAERYLGFHPIRPTQVVTIDSIPMADAPGTTSPPTPPEHVPGPSALNSRPGNAHVRAQTAALAAPAPAPARLHP